MGLQLGPIFTGQGDISEVCVLPQLAEGGDGVLTKTDPLQAKLVTRPRHPQSE